LKQKRS